MQWQLAPDRQAASQVRREAVRWLDSQHLEPLDDAAVVIAELLANAVCAANQTVLLDVEVESVRRIGISVTDDGPGFRTLPARELPPIEAEGSRGLFLVRTLSTGFSVGRTTAGTTVRCSLAISAAGPA